MRYDNNVHGLMEAHESVGVQAFHRRLRAWVFVETGGFLYVLIDFNWAVGIISLRMRTGLSD